MDYVGLLPFSLANQPSLLSWPFLRSLHLVYHPLSLFWGTLVCLPGVVYLGMDGIATTLPLYLVYPAFSYLHEKGETGKILAPFPVSHELCQPTI
jgi:hypothetical protein